MSGEIVLKVPKVDELKTEVIGLEGDIASFTCQSAQDHELAQKVFRRVSAQKKRIEDIFREPKNFAYRTWKSIGDQERALLEPLDKARRILNQKLSEYEDKEKKRAEAEARERQAAARREEEERQLAEAVSAEEVGDKDLAEDILNAPVEVPVILPEPQIAKVAGVSRRETWGAEVQNFRALVQHVAKHECYELLEPNMTALNAMARALKKGLALPGVRAVSSVIRAVRE